MGSERRENLLSEEGEGCRDFFFFLRKLKSEDTEDRHILVQKASPVELSS